MSTKRKDNKGRILKTGESQRKDGLYQYRYTDRRGCRHTVYASDLESLRKKENTILKDTLDGLDPEFERLTVEELIERHIEQRRRLRPSTKRTYLCQLESIKKFEIASMLAIHVKKSDVVRFCLQAADAGRSYSTIQTYKTLLSSSFKDAVDDDMIRKNPVSFRLADYIENESAKVTALTSQDVADLLEFVRLNSKFQKHYDMIIILLYTGVRVSELCGLTRSDIDFKSNDIIVNHQLCRIDGKATITKTKTATSNRRIPMSKEVRDAFERIVTSRKNTSGVEHIIDGQKGFLFVTSTGRPRVGNDIRTILTKIMEAYNAVHEKKLRVTPHVFRHTFCTALSNANVSPKTIQYLMGHSDLNMMKIYDDAQYSVVKDEFLRNMWVS